MEPTDLTLEALRSIRDAMHDGFAGLGARVDQTNERLDQTLGRLDRLERRQTESEVRVATQLVAVVGAVNEVRDLLRDELGLRGQVQDHEQRLRSLERRQG